MTLHEAIEQFLSAKKVDQGLAKNSTDSYAKDLLQFEDFVGRDPAPELESISESTLEAFLQAKKSEGLKPTSLARKASALRQLFKFCAIEFELETNPAENLQAPSAPRRLPKVLSAEKITALLETTEEGIDYESTEKADALRARDRAMLLLLYATGLRVTELITLRLEQFDFDLNLVRVMGKGSKERLVPFAERAREKLVDYRDHHRPLLLPVHLREGEGERAARAPFFVNAKGFGEPLTRQGFWKLLKQLGMKAGLTEDLSPHWIRHSFATHLLEGGLNLRTLQLLLGHADVSTTQIYTEMSPGHLKEVHEKFHPRGEPRRK